MERHLNELREALIRWHEHQYRMTTGTVEEQKEYWIRIVNDDGTVPSPPQPDTMILQARLSQFGMSYWSGGYANQPYVLMEELKVVMDVNEEYRSKRERGVLDELLDRNRNGLELSEDQGSWAPLQ